MRKIRNARCASLMVAGVLLFGAGFLTGKTSAGKKTLIHVFAFKQVPGTTPAQMDEMWAATRKLAAESPEIKSIWMGKVLNRGDQWQYGVVMEFDDQAALKKYAASPAHEEWLKTYTKVRVEGTNTLDIQGQ
jgi:antibiotic biosynthesis monooxygenase (ABM) superfamily enzyme